MAIQLTEQQQQQLLRDESGTWQRVLIGDREYILVPADLYEQLEPLLNAEEIDPSFFEFDEASDS